MFKYKGVVPLLLVTLTACGGSSSSEKSPVGYQPVDALPPLNAMSVPTGALNKASSSAFERHLKQGVFLRAHEQYRINFGDTNEQTNAQTQGSFSTTNLQEQGVDEADRIKYDGQYLFITQENHGVGIFEGDGKTQANTYIRVLERDTSGAMAEVNRLVVNEEATSINGIYLHQDKLAVLSDIYSYDYGLSEIAFFPTNNTFNLSLLDVTNPASTNEILSFTIDGAVIDSRRINNTLYIVSSYRASMEGIVYTDQQQEKINQYNRIMQTDISELLPSYTDSDGTVHPLVSAADCLISENATEKDGFDGLVTITAIDLSNPQNMKSSCINSQVQGLYASSNSLYLYGTDYQIEQEIVSETSTIHKFTLTESDANYRASGTLDGRFNWQLSNLRFSESGDYLRVVTTSGNRQEGFIHRLNVLKEAVGQLAVVAQLPNEEHSTPIGKVEKDGIVYEDIEAVRFFGDKAYIVTFLNSDPLYVLDLENPLSPFMMGALEVPGYSAYLHPISDQLLLGVGQNVNPDILTGGGTDNAEPSPIIEGAKVSLFDVSNLAQPKEIRSIVFEGAYTPIEFDYHALSYLKMADNTTRFAVPIERWKTETRVGDDEQKYDVWYTENQLAILEVTGITNDSDLRDVGYIKAREDDSEVMFGQGWQDRSIFHDQHIYYIHGENVWHSMWPDLTEYSGPY